MCAGVESTRAGSQKKAGRGEGGAGPGRGRAELLEGPPLLPSPALFLNSHGTPPATPGRPHSPPRQSSVCSFAGCLASLTVPAAAAPSSSTLICSSSSPGRSMSVSSPRRPSKQPLALGCSAFLLALPLPTLNPPGRTSRTFSRRPLGTTLRALRVPACPGLRLPSAFPSFGGSLYSQGCLVSLDH